jgi:hypothetical protein
MRRFLAGIKKGQKCTEPYPSCLGLPDGRVGKKAPPASTEDCCVGKAGFGRAVEVALWPYQESQRRKGMGDAEYYREQVSFAAQMADKVNAAEKERWLKIAEEWRALVEVAEGRRSIISIVDDSNESEAG